MKLNILNLSRYTVTPNIERCFTEIYISPLLPCPVPPQPEIFFSCFGPPRGKKCCPAHTCYVLNCHIIFAKHYIRSSTNHAVSYILKVADNIITSKTFPPRHFLRGFLKLVCSFCDVLRILKSHREFPGVPVLTTV